MLKNELEVQGYLSGGPQSLDLNVGPLLYKRSFNSTSILFKDPGCNVQSQVLYSDMTQRKWRGVL